MSIIGDIKDPAGIIEDARSRRIQREQIWDQVRLFIKGSQWLKAPTSGDANWRRLEMESGSKLFVTVNKMLSYFRAAQARLMISFPGVGVVPASSSEEDITKALTSAQILEYFWHECEIDSIGMEATRYLAAYGCYVIHEYYCPATDENPRAPKGEGEVKLEVISPYNWFVEPGAVSLKESEYVVLRTYVTKRQLRNEYPDQKDKLVDLVSSERDESSTIGGIDKVPDIDRFEKLEWYGKDGSHGVSVGDIWFERDNNYFDPKFFPIQIVYYTELDDDVHGMGLMEPLQQLQWLFNWTRTRIVRNMHKMGHAKVFVPRGSEIRKADWDDTGGGLVPFNPNAGKPIPWSPSVNMGQDIDLALRLQGDMDDVAGMHAVSRGKQVPGMRSGKAIESLSEMDSTDMVPTLRSIEAGFRKAFCVVLHLMKKHYKQKRWMRMFDIYSKPVFHELRNTDLVDAPDVFIKTGSMFKDSQDKYKSEVLELFQLGLVTMKEAQEALTFNMGGNHRIMRKIQGLSRAMKFLEDVKNGAKLRLNVNDDLDAVKSVFEEFMGSEDFYMLPDDVQEYMGNILAAIATQGMAPEQRQAVMAQRQVFPLPEMPPGTGMPVQAGPGMAQTPADNEAAEQVLARRNEVSPIGREL